MEWFKVQRAKGSYEEKDWRKRMNKTLCVCVCVWGRWVGGWLAMIINNQPKES